MATEKLINANEFLRRLFLESEDVIESPPTGYCTIGTDPSGYTYETVTRVVQETPAVDAVPVDEIRVDIEKICLSNQEVLLNVTICGKLNEVKIPFSKDVAEVVHGRWEWLGPNRLVPECMCGTCSVCKVRSKYIVNTDICPTCGATMDRRTVDGK